MQVSLLVMTCPSICTTPKASWRNWGSQYLSGLDPSSGPQLNEFCPHSTVPSDESGLLSEETLMCMV